MNIADKVVVPAAAIVCNVSAVGQLISAFHEAAREVIVENTARA